MGWTEAEWAIVRNIESKLDHLSERIEGNGKPGLCEQAKANRVSIATLERLQRVAMVLLVLGCGLWLWHVAGGDPVTLGRLIVRLVAGL